MASTDKPGYVKAAMAGPLAMLMAAPAALAESKFLSLDRFTAERPRPRTHPDHLDHGPCRVPT